jgi:hypothetical protein
VILAFAVVVPILLGLVVLLSVLAIRNHYAEGHRLTLSHHYFCGHPQVVLQLAGWKLSAADIQLLAWRRGYVEVIGPNPSILVFRLAEPMSGGPTISPAATPGQPTQKQLRRRRRLSMRLTIGDIAWVQPKALGIGMAELDHIAQSHGLAIVRKLGDLTDPMVLLSRIPIWRLNDAIDPKLGATLTSFVLRNLINAVSGVVGMALVSLSVVLLNPDKQDAIVFGLIAVVIAVVVNYALRFTVMRRDTTHRMSLMMREFNGRKSFSMYPDYYMLDLLVIGDVANELGYAYVGSSHGIFGSARWNGSRIGYMRTPRYQPRGQR